MHALIYKAQSGYQIGGWKEIGVGKKETITRWAEGLSKTKEVAPRITATVREKGYEVILVRQNHSIANCSIDPSLSLQRNQVSIGAKAVISPALNGQSVLIRQLLLVAASLPEGCASYVDDLLIQRGRRGQGIKCRPSEQRESVQVVSQLLLREKCATILSWAWSFSGCRRYCSRATTKETRFKMARTAASRLSCEVGNIRITLETLYFPCLHPDS